MSPRDPLQAWTRLASTRQSANPYWSAYLDRVRLPDGNEHDYHYVRTPGSVLIVPVARSVPGAEPRLLMVRQYRYLLGDVVLEFPGGGIKPGQEPLAAAQAELAEETGYRAAHWRSLGWFNPCKGLLAERCHVYLAEELARDTGGTHTADATEEIALAWQSSAALDTLIRRGEVYDGMTLCAWSLARTACGCE